MRPLTGIALAALLLLGAAARAAEGSVLVFAAASMTDALTEVGRLYAETGAPAPAFSFAASSALARQIENGAPAGIFVSADEQWMDYLEARGLLAADTRVPFLGNALVLIAPKDSPLDVRIAPGFALAEALHGGRLALADPDAVPAGRYARAALESLGAWRDVEATAIRADNVRAALVYVARGEAAAGVVYATDAMLEPGVVVAGAFPEQSHPPVSYPLAVLKGHDTAAARTLRAFMLSDAAKAVYERYGFTVK